MTRYYVSYMQLDNSGLNYMNIIEHFSLKKEMKKYIKNILENNPDWAKPQNIEIFYIKCGKKE